ncbi:MAG: succinylglutamate desuccinylase/aspartoacylase family protein [Alphaproteobacteria bacterium]|nr:succinylglutamate desuccinylase/aspartoacylase family protein [Alphaproteobacteria bacterium]
MTNSRYTIDHIAIKRGERLRINIDMGSIYDFTDVKMPVEVIRGKKDGPTLFVSSTIHGDEINGIEITRRLLAHPSLKNISGMLIVIPVVNIFGFNDRSRYLPDRRDLNRCFPGLKSGSLTSQLAYKFMQEIVLKSDIGIDLHTGAFHRCNFQQIRANISDPKTFELARAFNAPVIVDSNLRDGSLRAAVMQANIPMILFEAGEALRFDDHNIQDGVEGVLNVMGEIGMIESRKKSVRKKIFIAHSSFWMRAPCSGINIPSIKLGNVVKKGDVLSEISNPFGDHKILVKAHESGIVIGMSLLPLTNKGDALFHIASEKQRKVPDAVAVTNHDYYENADPVNAIG